MADSHRTGVSQKQLAEALALTARQVRNLTDDGTFTRRSEGGQLVYDLGDAVQAYVRYKIEREAKGSASKETILDLQAKKLEIEVAVADLALAQQRGQLVTLDYMESQIKGLLESLRARCLNMPGKFARELAEAPDPAAALLILERLSTELLQALSEAGEDPELDDEADEDGGPEGEGRADAA